MGPLTESEVYRLLKREEGQFLEFKSLWDLEGEKPRPIGRLKVRDWVAEYVAAFANADGGTIIFGVDDDGTPSGHGYTEEVVNDFLAVAERRLRPAVSVRSQRMALDEHELILMEVPLHPVAVMVEGNGFPLRVDDQVIRESEEAINARKQAYRRVGYERQTRAEATLEDIDLDLARKFFSETIHRDRSVEEALQQYGLIIPRSGGTAVTNAALLLFGRRPFTQWHPRAGIRLFRVSGTERRPGKDRNVEQVARIEPPLALAVAEAQETANGLVRRSEKLHSLFFREMPEYPTFAWQEAIVNAIAHRDYNDQGREIEVWFLADRMEVQSPGDLVPPVTLEHIRERRRTHASRNPLLVRVLADARLMREEGEGIPRMYEEMVESFLKPPEFELDSATFTVTLRNAPIFEGPSPEWQVIVDQFRLSTQQKRVLLGHPDGFTNEDYRTLNKVDRDQAYREIQDMVDSGILLPTDSHGRGAVYRISPDLCQARAWLEMRIPRLRSHFEHHDRLTNRHYRELFDVTRYAAVKELQRLVVEGYLRLVGEKRGAHYVPGENVRGPRE